MKQVEPKPDKLALRPNPHRLAEGLKRLNSMIKDLIPGLTSKIKPINTNNIHISRTGIAVDPLAETGS